MDDEAVVRNLLLRALISVGFEVRAAESGEKALEEAGQHRFDLVLLDIALPGLDGLQVLQRLRALYPECLVIMLTAKEDLELARTAMTLGACDYLTKPIEIDTIRKVLRTHLAFSSNP